MNRLRALCFGADSGKPRLRQLTELFSQLPSVDSLSIFAERCPFPKSDTAICKFWDDYLESLSHGGFREKEDNLHFRYLVAAQQYKRVILSLKHLKAPLRKLTFDFMPYHYLLSPDPGQISTSQDLFGILRHFLSHVTELQMVIAIDNTDRNYPDKVERCASNLSSLLSAAPNLRSLILKWSDRRLHGLGLFTALRDAQTRTYIQSWEPWGRRLFQFHWPHLKTLKLVDLRTPDTLLTNFVIKHTTIRKLSLTGCFLGYDEHNHYWPSWGNSSGYSNIRLMLEAFKKHLKLDCLDISFSTEEEHQLEYEKEHQPKLLTSDPDLESWMDKVILDRIHSKIDSLLLFGFVSGWWEWPMATDSPDLCWDETHCTVWTRLPRWEVQYEEGPEPSGRDFDPMRCLRPTDAWWKQLACRVTITCRCSEVSAGIENGRDQRST